MPVGNFIGKIFGTFLKEEMGTMFLLLRMGETLRSG